MRHPLPRPRRPRRRLLTLWGMSSALLIGAAQAEVGTGTLEIDAASSSAQIVINGRRVGVTPLAMDVPADKPIELQVQQEGCQLHQQTVQVAAGETLQIEVSCEAEPPPEEAPPATE